MTIYTIIRDAEIEGAQLAPNVSCESATEAMTKIEDHRTNGQSHVRVFRGQREIPLAELKAAAAAELSHT